MSVPSAHKQRYKNASLDADELRRRREEEGIQLRKQKREEQLSKRRNVINVQDVSDDEMQVRTRANSINTVIHDRTKFYKLS